ncbi:hypothetical protein [Amycolatopsis sp. SID8362]|uniref:hypothetical protein n=1 Tax=Amycolatopsis sp. SID8362 TaxID=2690346 RepID=UPI001367FBA3|nr:hypothetical protein [Amycolatopsis sp. SID8362]NBH11116.1 hypothetical protein [Amycolatopsis sp. SID8362]NED47808.1 hypothetical protein [Amycolatopsis sp. SID8362]
MSDDTTRYLCAASYLDPGFGTRAIKEFLVEPTRPVPASPGIDTGRVLTEAVRARARRKNYDAILVLLMAVVVSLSWDNVLLYAWIVVSVLLVAARAGKTAYATQRTFNPKTLVVIGFSVVAVWLLVTYSDVLFDDDRSRYAARYEDYYDESSGGDTARLVVGIVLAVVVLVVVTIERWSLWNLLTSRFRRLAPPSPDTGSLTGAFTEDFREQLARFRRDDEFAGSPGAPLVVYRGYNPFVGAGFRRAAWSMAIPLERVEDVPESRPELTTEALYEGIRAAIGNLRNSSALSPDRRLAGLTVTEAVFTPAAELIDHLAEPEAAAYLPDIEHPPHTRLTEGHVGQLRTEPKEWARYYLCFQVETWDRELVLTTFLHVAVDDTTLYVEWTPFMLPPVKAEYRAVDKMRPDSLRPFGQGLLAWLEMPASLPVRIANLASWIRRPGREPGVLDPDRYGTAKTLRELGSVNLFTDYFQLVDIERYEKIIESRLLPAIGKLLGDAGFSTAKFDEQAAVVINNDITIEGDNRAPITQTGVRGDRRRRPPGKPEDATRTEA